MWEKLKRTQLSWKSIDAFRSSESELGGRKKTVRKPIVCSLRRFNRPERWWTQTNLRMQDNKLIKTNENESGSKITGIKLGQKDNLGCFVFTQSWIMLLCAKFILILLRNETKLKLYSSICVDFERWLDYSTVLIMMNKKK